MRLYIGPCGLGLGHVTRCVVVAREFRGTEDIIVFSSYLDGLDYVKRLGFRYFGAVPISFRTREDGTVDPKLTATQNGVTVGLWKLVKQLLTEVRHISTFGPDIVLSDTRVSTLLAAKILRRRTCLILNQYSVQMPHYRTPKSIADRTMLFFGRIVWKYATALLALAWMTSDRILVPDLGPPYTISKYNLAVRWPAAGRIRLIGPVTHDAKRLPNETPKIGTPRRLLIFACISGPSTDRKFLVRTLSKAFAKAPAEWNIVMSCGDPRGSDFPSRQGNLTVFDWMNEDLYEDTFQSADVIVSRAGHGTIMRAISSGKPIVLIPPPSHTEQANNARRAAELGVGVVLDQSDLTTEALVKSVAVTLSNGASRAIEISQLTHANGGAAAVVEAINELAMH